MEIRAESAFYRDVDDVASPTYAIRKVRLRRFFRSSTEPDVR